MSRPIPSKYPLFLYAALCISLTISFTSCSGGVSDQSAAAPSATGAISFSLAWQRPPASRAKAQFSPPFNACVDYGIDTIAATVSDATTTVASGSWPCSAHEGLILGVPAGENYTVQVEGISSGPTTTIWRGLASPITVNTGQITSAGTITMGYIGTDTTQPTVTSIAPLSNPTNTTAVPVTDRIIITFSEPMAISTVNATSITLINSSASSTVSGIVSYVPASNAAAFIPSANLAYDTQYVLQATPGITDLASKQLESGSTNTITTESEPIGAPDAPSNVTAEPGNGQVTLDWLASNGSTSYNIYYLSSAGVTTTNGTLISDVRPPYVHLGLTNSQTYYYLASAVNGTGETQAAAEVSATPIYSASTTSVPSPPVSLTATPGIGQNVLTWPAAAGATSYNLYWSTTPITGKTSADNVIRDIPGNINQYTHTGLASAQTYYYVITVMNSFGESTESMQAAATPD